MTIVEDAFSALVDQFKDPFAFVRELVQNALDAGSTTIDVDARHEGGVVSVEVQDTGDGMDREIIETKLVRLFASSKDGDATKIGKFGIGFASVFSIRPEAVVVDTARGGERWRVVFAPDGTWKMFTLDEAIEGTRVRVLKRVTNDAEAARITEQARLTLVRWCRYADAEIRFGGVSIREDFDLALPVRVRVPLDAPGDIVVVGLRLEAEAVWGFFNKGLTLLEGAGAFEGVPPWVSFRVRDGALEHTITRDNVIRDDAFLRVISRVHAIATGELLDATLRALEDDHPRSDELCRALIAPHKDGMLKSAARQHRRPFRSASGAHVSFADVHRAHREQRLLAVDGPGALADTLSAADHLVVRAPRGSGAAALLEACVGAVPPARELFVAAATATEKEQWDAAPLLHAMAKLLPGIGVAAADVILGRVEDDAGQLTDAPFVVVPAPGRPIARADATTLPTARTRGRTKRKAPPPVLVLNARCVAVRDALALSRTDLWLAAFLLLRHARADAAFDAAAEAELAEHALSLRRAGS